ncbi:MAG: ATP-binding protein [Candidatus Pacebacteria bacterium]|jgi:CO dehydrogenase maturation factor|nr:ATP-binding protein [Candidatus Paceibacterota bacterium]
MKIGFVGKGGSGKTTIASLFIKYLAYSNQPVIAIDSDINQHLGESVGFTRDEIESIPPLGTQIELLSSIYKGTNPRLQNTIQFKRTTPPGTGSTLIKYSEEHAVLKSFEIQKNGIRLLRVGIPQDETLGEQCYHANMSGAEIYLNHLIDKENEYVVVDLTAGIDTLASGMFVSYDIIYIVVEPTAKSLSVFNDYIRIAKSTNIEAMIYPIANKITTQEELEYIEKNIDQKPIAVFPLSSYIRKTERGEYISFGEIEKETRTELEKIHTHIQTHTKNWEKFYKNLLYFHNKKASKEKHLQLQDQIDPEFNMLAFL